ncbi:chromosome segregation protein SMC [methane-oxidizing endosymbiont of Gigantopelta aegis]|uniref:chromosome segregation protein SMC n=1 Tax=methane-oxidizing endosymbiont of Gigantopelta aegis TaxID=2794938 RepID=UPI0018DC6848|nr:chromosome segregation protein SMC [methane-oxidizing endosymbiont of Gigantopelta aegis]
MKLEKIKLSGFKSFVDPTTVPITSNLTAIVGPNGCGKSNIIDAVRWVMGESSAKHLRGGSMADVIFNGSSGRKPVSTASVELIFDNSEGRAGGEFAKYNTLSIKRQVSRDGQSLYMLNGSRCRRKDITDLFLGTGLGSRSYAIIEQGTISRMVEAKPDELRVHIEEAAGVSKYKERRHETETRMRHTRENLERLDDLREEVSKQLAHLKKQAEKAEQYTALKKQERQIKEQHLAMRWRHYQQLAEQLEEKLQDVAEQHNRLFMRLREIDHQIEAQRSLQKQSQQQVDAVQSQYYQVVSDVSALEQTLAHQQQSHQETVAEINRLRQQLEQMSAEYQHDVEQLEQIRQSLMAAEEDLQVAQEQAEETEQFQYESQQQKQQWQQEWEAYLAEQGRFREQNEIQRVKLTQLESQLQQLQARAEKLQIEQAELQDVSLEAVIESLAESIEILEEQRENGHQQLEQKNQDIGQLRQQLKQLQILQHRQREEMHHVQGKITSLEMLQQHAMGKDKKGLQAWLEQHELGQKPRLAEFLTVQDGWETAVEQVLHDYLEAVCVDDLSDIFATLSSLGNETVTFFATRKNQMTIHAKNQLSDKIQCDWDLSALLSGVYVADDLAEAQTLLADLKDWEMVVLKDGTRLGKNWLRIDRVVDGKTGILQRSKELKALISRQQELDTVLEQTESTLEQTEQRLKDSEALRDQLQQQDKQLAAELARKQSEYSAQSAHFEQQQRRLQQIEAELQDIQQQQVESTEQRTQAEVLQQEAERVLQGLQEKRHQLELQSEQLQALQQSSEQSVNEARRKLHTLEAHISSLKSEENLLARQLERLATNKQQAAVRLDELEQKLQSTLAPMDDEKIRLEQLKARKLELEQQLNGLRETLQGIEQRLLELTEEHNQIQRQKEQQKEKLDEIRFQQQDSLVRQQTLTEQLEEIAADIERVLAGLPDDADEARWKRKLDEVSQQIQCLGTINLTAIEEYKSQSERMDFLNEQHADLVDALNTLDQAISKIDRESRQRFKETFDKINQGLQEKFPKLFGGGQAYLELTDDDLLEAGVNIIARPPGKRNSSIHLLSGGEKALTAVALVFSIFELNPAPFCLLDEVDAPLDDANVSRFSKMVEEMSESVQFLYISHNKVTMEIAKQLTGVTMKEPGVSRMVAVDLEEAVTMAES